MPTPTELDEYQQAQVALVTLASDDLRTFWGDLDATDASATRTAMLEFVPLLTTQYGEAAAALAGDWYDDLRSRERLTSAFAAVLAEVLPVEQIENQVGYAAHLHLGTDDPDGMLVNLLNVLGKDVLQPGWDTIVNSTNLDPDTYGWHRETRSSRSYSSGCGFCRMLAGRGGVYKRSTATFAAHGRCRCVAYPSFDPDAQEVGALEYMASSKTMTAADRKRVYAFIGDGPERTRF